MLHKRQVTGRHPTCKISRRKMNIDIGHSFVAAALHPLLQGALSSLLTINKQATDTRRCGNSIMNVMQVRLWAYKEGQRWPGQRAGREPPPAHCC